MHSELKALPVSAITSDEVETQDGEKLGMIKDLVIDLEQGRIAYAVLSFGGIFGIGSKLFAVPWQAFRVRGHTLVLDVKKELLKKAPGLDEDQLPPWSNVPLAIPDPVGAATETPGQSHRVP
jgi:sporulation protein YlmC with PRC-barrel domain